METCAYISRIFSAMIFSKLTIFKIEVPSYLYVDYVLFHLLEILESRPCLLSSFILAGFWVVCFFCFSGYPSSRLYFSFFSYFATSIVWGRIFGVLGFLWTQVWLLWPMQEELHIWCFSSLLLSLRRIQIKFSEGMKGFLANCRDFLPLFCLEVYKQNIPEPWNVVFHKCLMKNTFY